MHVVCHISFFLICLGGWLDGCNMYVSIYGIFSCLYVYLLCKYAYVFSSVPSFIIFLPFFFLVDLSVMHIYLGLFLLFFAMPAL